MATEVRILVIDDDETSQSALRQMLDSEGWQVKIVPLAHQALAELARTDWKLVIVNVAMSGLSGPLYLTLKELALAPPVEGGKTRVRVLFLVPELAGAEAQPVLEKDRLPYSLKPLHLHDFLEKVSDLLMETDAIATPIRRVRYGLRAAERQRKDRRGGPTDRNTGMFASRDDYMMTEEEIADYERQEKEEAERKKKKKQPGEI